MRHSKKDINTISEAIEHLEKASAGKTNELKDLLGKDLDELKQAFENIKPQITKIKEDLEHEAKKTKNQIEDKVKENPWLAISIVGLIGLFIGWLIGRDRK